MTSRLTQPSKQSSTRVMADLRQMELLPTMAVGALVVLLFFGGLGAWAAIAPLDSAAIAAGTLSVQSRRKTIQHLEGGIVSDILVDEGSVVAAGDPLIRMDTTQAQIRYGLYHGQLRAAAALAARLRAERDGLDTIAFADWLLTAQSDPEVAQILTGQRNIFVARREAKVSQTSILNQRILQLEEEIGGLEGQIAAQNSEIGFINSEIATVRDLLDQGLATRPRLLSLQREKANVEGERAQNIGGIARAEQRIGEAQLEIEGLGTEMINAVVQELRQVETHIADLNERIAAARDILERTEITAPVAGTVVGLNVFTTDGIIHPGAPLMEIVPIGDVLIVEARIDPIDIDVVQPGQEARVRFSAFSRRRMPSFTGRVQQISADLLTDARSGITYYLARISIDENQAGLDGIELYPGMQAEIMIKTGARTALRYLLDPLTQSMNRALRDS